MASATLGAVKVQPKWGLALTDVSVTSVGMEMATLVVPAVSDSFGTRTVILPEPSWRASVELTLTCAEAPAASATAREPRARVMAPVEKRARERERTYA